MFDQQNKKHLIRERERQRLFYAVILFGNTHVIRAQKQSRIKGQRTIMAVTPKIIDQIFFKNIFFLRSHVINCLNKRNVEKRCPPPHLQSKLITIILNIYFDRRLRICLRMHFLNNFKLNYDFKMFEIMILKI